MMLFGIHFAQFQYIIFAPILALIAFLCVCAFYYRHTAIRVLAGSSSGRFLIRNYYTGAQLVKRSLYTLAAFFLFAALLRPQWDKKEEQIEHLGRDVIIALDISRSMLCDDVSPNRLAFAKEKIKKLVRGLSCERVGLLLFAGSPFLTCPLTTDYDSFFMFLDQVDAQTISSGGTSMDQAIALALSVFHKMPERKNKLLVMLTDGEDFSNDMALIRSQAQEENMHIFALGIGTHQGAPVPLLDAKGAIIGHQKNKEGAVVISRLDESSLQKLVDASGGTYLTAQEKSNADVQSLIDMVTSFEKEKIEDKKKNAYQEKYYYCAFLSFICLVLEWLL